MGRVSGSFSSDVSSYLARILFYDRFEKTNNMKFTASSFSGTLKIYTDFLADKFKKSGYNAVAVTSNEEMTDFDPVEWKDQDLIYYADHSFWGWAGIYAGEIPRLKNSLIVLAGCSTLEVFGENYFSGMAIRQGAVGVLGAVTTTFLASDYEDFMKQIYSGNKDLGTAFKDSYRFGVFNSMTMLLGDPTFNINPTYSVKALGSVKEESSECKEDGGTCSSNLDCMNGTCIGAPCGHCSWMGRRIGQANGGPCAPYMWWC